MVDGAKYIVTESLDEVINRIVTYRARVLATARDLPTVVEEPVHLGLVSDFDPDHTHAHPRKN
jgi:flagellar protein FlbD